MYVQQRNYSFSILWIVGIGVVRLFFVFVVSCIPMFFFCQINRRSKSRHVLYTISAKEFIYTINASSQCFCRRKFSEIAVYQLFYGIAINSYNVYCFASTTMNYSVVSLFFISEFTFTFRSGIVSLNVILFIFQYLCIHSTGDRKSRVTNEPVLHR